MKVLFATKCYLGDYFKVLARFNEKKESCSYPFDSTLLVLNNGMENVPRNLFEGISPIIDAKENEEAILGYFGLNRSDFIYQGNDGYVYAIGELAALFTAIMEGYDYLCYVQGDAMLEPASDWVTPAIDKLTSYPDILVVSPSSEVNTWHNNQNVDHYFSDWVFLVKPADFTSSEVFKAVKQAPREYLADYPVYGGNSFEKLMGSYLKVSGKYRYILPDHSVIHPV
jgi:hypothetical protein